MKFLGRSLSSLLICSLLTANLSFASTGETLEVIPTFSETVREMKYLLANDLIKNEDAIATFSSKLMKLSEQNVDVLTEAKNYALSSAKSSSEKLKIETSFNNAVKQNEQINEKARKDLELLIASNQSSEEKELAIVKTAKARISLVNSNLMQNILKSTTGANFLGCSELNTKLMISIGIIVLGATITVIGLTKALLTEKAIIRRHDRQRNRVNRRMDRQDAVIVETEERNLKIKAEMEAEIAMLEEMKANGQTHYTDANGDYWNIDQKLEADRTELYWANEELGNIAHYWWEDNTDRAYQLEDVMDDQIEDIENLDRTHTIGYIMTGAGAAILSAGVVTGAMGIKQCR